MLRKGEGLPSENPLSYMAFSNIYKWVWHGAENTLQQKSTPKFLDRTKEVELILDEIRLLDPDISSPSCAPMLRKRYSGAFGSSAATDLLDFIRQFRGGLPREVVESSSFPSGCS